MLARQHSSDKYSITLRIEDAEDMEDVIGDRTRAIIEGRKPKATKNRENPDLSAACTLNLAVAAG